jgi:alpha-galactosidase
MIIEFHVTENQIVLVLDINNVKLSSNEEKLFFDFNLEKFDDLNNLEYFKKFSPRTTNKLVGYSSWYNHFDKVNESILIENLRAVDKNHFNLFQIDDGHESAVGDWEVCNHEKFPNGLRSVV